MLQAEHLTWQQPRTWLASDDPACAEQRGVIVQLYAAPPAGSPVLCLDELGPIAARCYPGPSWSHDAHRPHFRPAYARHGYRWRLARSLTAAGRSSCRRGRLAIPRRGATSLISWGPSLL